MSNASAADMVDLLTDSAWRMIAELNSAASLASESLSIKKYKVTYQALSRILEEAASLRDIATSAREIVRCRLLKEDDGAGQSEPPAQTSSGDR